MGRCYAKPRHLISDRGGQFDFVEYKNWAKRKKIRFRYGAVGKYGSIAVIERFIRTMKEFFRKGLVPAGMADMRRAMTIYCEWYNESRPHEYLHGRTPDEVYFHQFPANRKPRYEPRPNWPRGSPCSAPVTLVRDKTGVTLALDVAFMDDQRRLPVVQVKKVA